ncbi:MAG: glycosyltransferase protein [Rhizobium sp.]|nr:glycosyltransferase protein [Rhizobium sp.]
MTSARECPVTICIPSNRPLALSKASLESAIRFAGAKGYRVVISDNSGEGVKFAHFSAAPDYVTYLDNPGLPPVANLLACLDYAATEFVLPMGDDDLVEVTAGEADFDFKALGRDVAGVRPHLEVFAVGEPVLRTHVFAIDAETAADRLYEYRNKIGGDNSLYYSYFRRSDFEELIRLVETNHPTGAGDIDWAIVYALLANGKIAYDRSTILKYDIGKWRWNEGIEASIDNIYASAGLPRQAVAFASLFRFMDSYVFAFRRTLAVSDIERIKVLYAFAIIFLGQLLHISEKQPEQFDGFEKELQILRAVLKEPDDYLVNVFEVCARIADRLKPGLHAQYIGWFAGVRSQSEAG